MFITLMKNELSYYYKLMLFSIVAVATGCFLTTSDSLTIIVLFGLECGFVVLCSIAYTFTRAYKTMASENAYYTFSIPAKNITIIMSKICAASIANIVVTVAVLTSMVTTRAFIMDEMNAGWFAYFGRETGCYKYSIIYDFIFSHFESYLRAFNNLNGVNIATIFIVVAGFFIVTTSLIYLSVIIGQMFSGNKMFVSVMTTFTFAIVTYALHIKVWRVGMRKHNIIWGGTVPIEKDFIPNLTKHLQTVSEMGCIMEIMIVCITVILAEVIINNKLNIKAE